MVTVFQDMAVGQFISSPSLRLILLAQSASRLMTTVVQVMEDPEALYPLCCSLVSIIFDICKIWIECDSIQNLGGLDARGDGIQSKLHAIFHI